MGKGPAEACVFAGDEPCNREETRRALPDFTRYKVQ